ncbi:MAG: LuxR C-terminal-related transcriptional regulator [Planctomycetota bacterium]
MLAKDSSGEQYDVLSTLNTKHGQTGYGGHVSSCPDGILHGAIEACAAACESLSELPAVATPDWLDNAASNLLTNLFHPDLWPAVSAPISATPRAIGLRSKPVPGTLLAIGLAGGQRPRGPLFEAVGLALQGAPMASSITRARLASLRSVELRPLSDAGNLGTAGCDGVASWVGTPSGLLQTDWRATSLGRLWAETGLSLAIAACAALPPISHLRLHDADEDTAQGRRIVLLLGRTEDIDDDGHATVTRSVIGRVARALAKRTSIALGSEGPTKWLTDREAEVLEHLTLGQSVREIAELLDRSPHTVHDHVKSLHRKLHAKSRGELVALALGRSPAEFDAPVPTAPGQTQHNLAVERPVKRAAFG